jgi:hypothetical protein
MVGKYGRGRAWEVTGQDSFVYALLGSEAAILDFANPAQPRLVSEIQLDYLPVQVAVIDSVLLTGRNGIDLWNIADPTSPVKLSHIPSIISNFAVVDTFLYFVSGDTFNAYNIARPAAPTRMGFCLDSGYVATATANTAILLMRDFMALVDVTNPSAPHRVGTYLAPPDAAAARGNLCCATFSNPSQPKQAWFASIDISVPANPRQLARLDSVGGYDIDVEGAYVFVSGRQDYEPFQVVSIADSMHPGLLGDLGIAGFRWGVWADLARNRAYVGSDAAGLQVIDITNPGVPLLDTVVLRADMAEDVWVDGNRAYIANYRAGMKVLDVSDPSNPTELGSRDSLGASSEAVAARDSFAYLGWWPGRQFRVIDVSDPLRPVQVAACSVPSRPWDVVLRDSLAYCAGRLRFYAVNVARPREPVVVGSCVTGDANSAGLSLADTLAYVGNFVTDVVNIRNPANPQVLGHFGRGAWNVSVRDTFAFMSSGGVFVYSVADPSQPRLIDSVSVGPNTYWVEAVGSLLYTGNSDGVRVVDASDVHNMRVRGFATTPYTVKRLTYDSPYVYASCWDAGVCILESTQVAVGEAQHAARTSAGLLVRPNPARTSVVLAGPGERETVTVRDITGRVVPCVIVRRANDEVTLNLANVQPGVYFVESRTGAVSARAKLVRQ